MRSWLLVALLSALNQVEAAAPRGRLYASGFAPPGVDATYDYVVIGGGTAGITIASRLAEGLPNATIAIIEAGSFYEVDNGNYSIVPGLALAAPFLGTAVPFSPQPLVDWGLVSVPQSGAAGRPIHYAQGKTLGGGSAINSMAFHRGTIGTYQRWAEIAGDWSYTFANVLPFFKKSVHLTPPNHDLRLQNATTLYDPSVFSPTGGPLQVSWPVWVDPPLTWFQQALTSIGLPISPWNFNSGVLANFAAWVPSSVDPRNSTRSSSQTSFLAESIEYSNMFVYTNARAEKILFDNHTKADGVTVNTQGIKSTISANKEVILSAGVFHSPQLLMLSGIGPKNTLQGLNIPIRSELYGVGQNMWDQILFPVVHTMDVPSAGDYINSPRYAASTLQQYVTNGTGALSSENGFIAFEKLSPALTSNFTAAAKADLATLPADWPELEFVSDSSYSQGTNLGIILACLSAPFSRGSVAINSTNPLAPPVINLGWLTDPHNTDAQVAVAGFKQLRRAWSAISSPSSVGPEVVPGPSVSTDDEILAYIRESVSTIYHAAATCSMGQDPAKGAVVDSQARVFGVKGLRVVDNSASPFAVPGHPQSTVYMLAEKIAAGIIEGC